MAAEAPISLRVGTSKTIGEYVIAPQGGTLSPGPPGDQFFPAGGQYPGTAASAGGGTDGLCADRGLF